MPSSGMPLASSQLTSIRMRRVRKTDSVGGYTCSAIDETGRPTAAAIMYVTPAVVRPGEHQATTQTEHLAGIGVQRYRQDRHDDGAEHPERTGDDREVERSAQRPAGLVPGRGAAAGQPPERASLQHEAEHRADSDR